MSSSTDSLHEAGLREPLGRITQQLIAADYVTEVETLSVELARLLRDVGSDRSGSPKGVSARPTPEPPQSGAYSASPKDSIASVAEG